MKEPENNAIQLFEDQKIRVAWDAEQEEWYFSVVDVVGVLTDSPDHNTGRKYWNKLKQRLKGEGSELVTNCHQLKMRAADGKNRLTDVADTEQLLRIIQSVPSKKAEPFKAWWTESFSCGLKMLMLIASYPTILNESTYLQSCVALEKNDAQMLPQFRNWNDFDYHIDLSTCTNIPHGLRDATLIIRDPKSKKTVWTLSI